MTQNPSKSNTSSSTPKFLSIPKVFLPLLAPARYKGIHGGRGSGKSHFFAGLLVKRAVAQGGLRWVCIREIQNSLDQSVKRLIEDKIAGLDAGGRFRVKENTIETPGDGLILFRGMQNHTAESIKSLEGYDGAWVEEAQSLSAKSLRLLRPTLRKAGSELWFSWNPARPEDPVDRLLRGAGRLKGALVVEANWTDNPWFPGTELDAERQADLARGAEDYEHVWEGAYRSLTEATVFAGRVTVERFETPEGSRFFFGADWGFASDPTVLVRGFIQDECLFVDHAVYGIHTELDRIPALFDQVPLARIWPIKADSSRPETISHIRARGFDIQPAEKWPGSVEDGIAFLKGFKRIVIHERCPELAREARLYSYKVDARTEEVLPVLLDRHNHGWDALRYALGRLIRRRGVVREVDLNIHA
jgi:phage terminase large subunit